MSEIFSALGDVLGIIIFFTVCIAIPLGFSIWNVINLFSEKRALPGLACWLTVIIGAALYFLLLLKFDFAGDWDEVIYDTQLHNMISSDYAAAFIISVIAGFAGLLVLSTAPAEKLPPLAAALSTAGVILLNVMQILFAVQLAKNVNGILDVLFYVYHANIFILSVSAVRAQTKEQIRIFNKRKNESENPEKKDTWLYNAVSSVSGFTALTFACLFFLIAILEVIFIITGQGVDAPIKAFTDTADWTFSKQTPPPPMIYKGHYLCTVAAGGHKKIVKPLRYGTRLGHTITVNRQLCIANAFEELIREKRPKLHKIVRGAYDKYGYPVSKHITTPIRADIVYILMKPLEWCFLIFLYLFDTRPERRIANQYLYSKED